MNIILVYQKFPTQDDCFNYLEQVRWDNKPTCPYCKSKRHSKMKQKHRYHCNSCNTSYSVTVGTIFHKTHLDLQKWFLGISLILNAKKGLSSRQLARHLEVNKNTAWYMAMRIRKAMFQNRKLLSGIVEMDETYIGGKPRKHNKRNDDPDLRSKRGRGTDKTPVVGMVERNGNIKASVRRKDQLNFKGLSRLIRENVKIDNTLMITDEYRGYMPLKKFIEHLTINHQICYADGMVHTNTIESFWAIVKRGLIGQFHKVSIKYLWRYIDEFCYRYNNRKNEEVFELTIQRALGVTE